MGKRTVSSTMILGQFDSHMQKNDVRPMPSGHTKKLTQNGSNLNVIAKTIKLLEENMGVNL